MATARIDSNVTTGSPNQEYRETHTVSSDNITIGTVVAIVIFILIVGFYSYKLQSPSYRRRLARRLGGDSESSRRETASTSETRQDVIQRFDTRCSLPSYDSVIRLEVGPPPYEFPPSYEEALRYIEQDRIA